ncbi:MAG: DUF2807 domain-containing protein [Bacteroidales bacterium]|nr:DUF2807 domain-containing protein [Bacteroidales bacterium]
MKKRILALMTLAALAIWQAGTANAGSLMKTYDLKDFDRIEAGRVNDSKGSGNKITPKMNVTIIRSDTYKVEAVFNEEAYADMYDFSVKAGSLYLSVKNSSKRVSPEPSVDITVWTPKMTSLKIMGVARVISHGTFASNDLTVDMSGVCTLKGLSAEVGSMSLDVSGAAEMTDFSIIANDRITYDISGAAKMTGQELIASNLNVDISGGAKFRDVRWSSHTMSIDVSGTAEIKEASLCFKKGSIDVSGASNIKFDMLTNANTVYIDASGATLMTMNGVCDDLTIETSGASKIDLSNFKCKNVRLDASGMSFVQVYVTDTFTYETSGMAKVDYYGDPTTIRSKSGNVKSH